MNLFGKGGQQGFDLVELGAELLRFGKFSVFGQTVDPGRNLVAQGVDLLANVLELFAVGPLPLRHLEG